MSTFVDEAGTAGAPGISSSSSGGGGGVDSSDDYDGGYGDVDYGGGDYDQETPSLSPSGISLSFRLKKTIAAVRSSPF